MKRLVISIDEVATLRSMLNDSDFDPAQYAVLCEVAGANGISMTLADTQRGIQERDVRLVHSMRKSFLNLRIPAEDAFVKVALNINPDMVTFVDVSKIDSARTSPLPEQLLADVIPDILPQFRSSKISVAVFCRPEIHVLRQLSKIDLDYVEFDCTEVTVAADSNEELVAFDKLTTATLAAAKLGLGVNCSGNIDYSHLSGLAAVPRLEDICMGRSILKRAFQVGVERSVREARREIMAYLRR